MLAVFELDRLVLLLCPDVSLPVPPYMIPDISVLIPFDIPVSVKHRIWHRHHPSRYGDIE